jgi:hypothetical protein
VGVTRRAAYRDRTSRLLESQRRGDRLRRDRARRVGAERAAREHRLVEVEDDATVRVGKGRVEESAEVVALGPGRRISEEDEEARAAGLEERLDPLLGAVDVEDERARRGHVLGDRARVALVRRPLELDVHAGARVVQLEARRPAPRRVDASWRNTLPTSDSQPDADCRRATRAACQASISAS